MHYGWVVCSPGNGEGSLALGELREVPGGRYRGGWLSRGDFEAACSAAPGFAAAEEQVLQALAVGLELFCSAPAGGGAALEACMAQRLPIRALALRLAGAPHLRLTEGAGAVLAGMPGLPSRFGLLLSNARPAGMWSWEVDAPPLLDARYAAPLPAQEGMEQAGADLETVVVDLALALAALHQAGLAGATAAALCLQRHPPRGRHRLYYLGGSRLVFAAPGSSGRLLLLAPRQADPALCAADFALLAARTAAAPGGADLGARLAAADWRRPAEALLQVFAAKALTLQDRGSLDLSDAEEVRPAKI